MPKPKNIEWIVTGTAKLNCVTTTVRAVDRKEAIRKANAGENIGGIDFDVRELKFKFAETDIDLD